MTYVQWAAQLMAKLSMGTSSRAARDWALARQAARIKAPEVIWVEDDAAPVATRSPLQAAE